MNIHGLMDEEEYIENKRLCERFYAAKHKMIDKRRGKYNYKNQ